MDIWAQPLHLTKRRHQAPAAFIILSPSYFLLDLITELHLVKKNERSLRTGYSTNLIVYAERIAIQIKKESSNYIPQYTPNPNPFFLCCFFPFPLPSFPFPSLFRSPPSHVLHHHLHRPQCPCMRHPDQNSSSSSSYCQ